MSSGREGSARIAASSVVAGAGLFFWFVALAPTWTRAETIFSLFFGGGDPGALTPSGQLATAVMGAVLIGWAATNWRATRPSSETADARVAASLLWGAVAWFVPDMIASLTLEAYGNVVMNLAFFGLLLWPVYVMRNKASRDRPGAASHHATARAPGV